MNDYQQVAPPVLRRSLKHICAIALVGCAAVAQAGSGDLDRNFGNRGVVTTDINNVDNSVLGVAIQSNGSIVAVGNASVGLNGRRDVALARYDANGLLDNSFGVGGKVLTNVLNDANGTGSDDSANAVALQGDGKIVVTGSTSFFDPTLGSAEYVVVIRYNPNGSLDTTFGTGGIVRSTLGRGADLRVLSDGKILVAASTLNRYNPNGSPDATFGTNGIATLSGSASALAVQNDGRIVVAYAVVDGTGTVVGGALARHHADGSSDTTFANSTGAQIADLAIQADGKIVTTGKVFTTTPQGINAGYAFYVARYNSNGMGDGTFGSNGVVVSNFGVGDEVAYALVLQADGKILVAGYVTTQSGKGSDADAAVARYTSSGILDTGFGSSGLAKATGSPIQANAIAVQSDGKIVTGGTAYTTTATGVDFSLLRYLP